MTSIDLTNRIIQPVPQPSKLRWHGWRRWLQYAVGVAGIVLPWTNILHVDVRKGSVIVFGYRASSGDGLAALLYMFLAVWCLVAVSYLYGRVWCGWVCPQTLASDFSETVKRRIERVIGARKSSGRKKLAAVLWGASCAVAALITGIVLTSYWIDPHVAIVAPFTPATEPWPAVAVWGIAALVFVDQIWIRRKFCTDVCPYGAFLGIVADNNTLAVRYLTERDDDCIRCGKCVTQCPTGIDIKNGVGQFGCIGCGECVDACNDVLGKRGIPGLIEYRYGTDPARETKTLSLMQQWGLWDARRLGVLAVIPITCGVLIWHSQTLQPLAAELSGYGNIYRQNGRSYNQYIIAVMNGTTEPQSYHFAASVNGEPAAAAALTPVEVRPHDTMTVTVSVAQPTGMHKSPTSAPVDIRVTDDVHTVTVHSNFVTQSVRS